MPVVRLPENLLNLVGDMKILSIRVFERVVILVGRVIWGRIK